MGEVKENTIPEKRKLAIDALRAFLALGVLYSHSLFHYPAGAVDTNRTCCAFFYLFRVPTFFFISGLIIYSTFTRISPASGSEKWGGVILLNIKKFRRIIIPAMLFTLVSAYSIAHIIIPHFLSIYYFLTALFFITLASSLIFNLIKDFSRKGKTLIYIVYAFTTTLFVTLLHDSPMPDYLYWRQILQGNLFFTFGLIVGMYPEFFEPKAKSLKWFVLIALLYLTCYVLVAHLYYKLSYYEYKALGRIFGPIFGVAFIYMAFCLAADCFSRESALGKVAYYLGQRTLPLYVMQDVAFIIVYDIIDVETLAHPELMAIATFFLSAVLTLMLHDLICLNKHINKYIFGRDKALYSIGDLLADIRSTKAKSTPTPLSKA